MDGTETTRSTPLRLWPGVVLVILMGALRFGLPLVAPDLLWIGVIGTFLTGLLFLVWWGFFSRAPGFERGFGVLLILAVLFGMSPLLHESIATAMMRLLVPLYALPPLCAAFLIWAAASRRLSVLARRWTMVLTLLVVWSPWALLRTGGFNMELDNDFAWRWSPTPEDLLLEHEEMPRVAHLGETAATEEPADEALPELVWPGFRGPARDGVVHGVQIATDWDASPPVELWRRPVGPGWSSFAVGGDRIYTQEQRGDDEVVACYDRATGEPVWRHRDTTRFWESTAGAGPRATPTLAGDRVYTLGATGIVNALDALDGTVVWTRNATDDTHAEIPTWGLAASPLVVGDMVVVATVGTLAGYDAATGELRWLGPTGGDGYSSPHALELDGIPQVLLLSKTGAVSVDPTDGALLWEYPWEARSRIVQPARLEDGDLLISRGEVTGLRRIGVTHGAEAWTFDERWTSARLKPYFSDLVVHRGHAFGIDGSVLTCIDVEQGQRAWKGGRYGSGQLLLLADQDLFIVLSESGELALVAANPERFEELARFQAIEGKTWNHPVLVGDTLLVRNAEEMAAFRLTLASN